MAFKYPMAGDLLEGTSNHLTANPAYRVHGAPIDGGPPQLRFVSIGSDGVIAGIASDLDQALRDVRGAPGGKTVVQDLFSEHDNPADPLKMSNLSLRDTGLEPLDLDEVLSIDLEDAYHELMQYYGALEKHGHAVERYKTLTGMSQNLLGQNYKTAKEHPEEPSDVMGLSFLPADKILKYSELDPGSDVDKLISKFMKKRELGTLRTLCTGSNQFCRDSCLVFTGRNVADLYNHRKKAIATLAFMRSPNAFARMLIDAIERHGKNAPRAGMTPYVRLNVLSDVPWERVFPDLFAYIGDKVRFYDYTKVAGRRLPKGDAFPGRGGRSQHGNYDLTFSFSGTNEQLARSEIANGRRVAVVFMAMKDDRGTWIKFERDARLPKTFWGLPVVDGDVSDVRPLDPAPSIVGLRWKTPGGRGIDPMQAGFKFVVPAYHIKDRVTAKLNPGGGYASEYMVVPVTPRFQPGVGLDES